MWKAARRHTEAYPRVRGQRSASCSGHSKLPADCHCARGSLSWCHCPPPVAYGMPRSSMTPNRVSIQVIDFILQVLLERSLPQTSINVRKPMATLKTQRCVCTGRKEQPSDSRLSSIWGCRYQLDVAGRDTLHVSNTWAPNVSQGICSVGTLLSEHVPLPTCSYRMQSYILIACSWMNEITSSSLPPKKSAKKREVIQA